MGSNAPFAQRPLAHRVALIGLVLAIVCALVAIGSGVGYRLGLWHFRTGFDLLKVAFYAALVAGVVSLAGLVLSAGRRPAVLFMGLVGLAISAVTAYMPWTYYRTVATVPRIHDITTDMSNPPQFIAAAKLRNKDDHPVAYEGGEIGAEQRDAYPDIQPLTTSAPKD